MAYVADLHELASRYGVLASYADVADRRCEATPETLFRTLQALGAPLAKMEDVPEALRLHRIVSWKSITPPVVVAWEGKTAVPIRLPEDQLETTYRYELTLDTGEVRRQEGRIAELPTRRGRDVDGVHYVIKRLRLPDRLPWGYHVISLEVAGFHMETMIISAPQRAYPGQPGELPQWGVFMPLYALHRRSSWGAGDFSDLQALMQWTADQGGSTVATLPLLASNGMDNPSPYAACSRLFWNEFYLDIPRLPEFDRSPEAQELLGSREVQAELDSLRRSRLVDYPRQMTLKRRILEILCQQCYLDPIRRAAYEKQQKGWPAWPEPLRGGKLQPGDYDERAYRYHLYAQWQTERQLEDASEQARASNLLWYLDYPLGVNTDGFDVWKNQDLFALGASGGAPPDSFFTAGQDWGFPPLHPEKLRLTRYRYFIDALRQHLHYADLLRIDHVMGFYRLYWVPHGMPATHGAYVRYPMDELFAILTLESHRMISRIVGENLGTVPPEVDQALADHGVGDMYVLQYEVNPKADEPIRPIPQSSVASLNTHDMPTFFTYWTGLDVDDRLDMKLLTPSQASQERDNRALARSDIHRALRAKSLVDDSVTDVEGILEGCLAMLGSSPAPALLVGLEDLWGETQPQNTPGTFKERANWQRKAKYTFEEFSQLPQVQRLLHRVAESRRQAAAEMRASQNIVVPGHGQDFLLPSTESTTQLE
jgi:4-alpha-glucanotransferase